MTTAFDGWPVGCLRLSPDDRVSLWNRQLATWTGLPAHEALGRPIAEMIPAWQRIGLALAATTVRQGGGPVVLGPGPLLGAFSGARAGATRQQVTLSADESEPGGVLIVVVDVALPPEERLRPTVASLDDPDERLRELTAQAPGGFYQMVFWPDGTMTVPFLSAGIGALFGMNSETVVNPESIATFLHPDDNTVFRGSFRQAAVNQTVWHCEFRVCDADGAVRWLETRAVPKVETDGSTVWNGLIHDVTDRRQAVEALNQSQALLAALIENTGDSVFVVDYEGRLLVANQRFLQSISVNYGLQFTIGDKMDGVPGGPDFSHWAAWSLRALAGESFTVEVDASRPGQPRFLQSHFYPVRVDGRIIAASCFSRDLTARRQMEAELLQQKELAEASTTAKSAFLATISHEIRTPLNGVMGMADLLADTLLSDEQKDYVQAMRQSAETLSTLLNDLLDLSRIEAGRLTIHQEAFRPATVVDAVVELVSHQAYRQGLELLVTLSPELPEQLIGDGGRLQQVLLNLASNAVKFTERGEVRLFVGGEAMEAGRWRLRLVVSDTGIGMPAELQGRLFGKFVQADASSTRKFGGSGLGLAICRELVTLMGGQIHCDSRTGHGTCFTVEVPVSVAAPAVPPPPTFAGKRVLVVGGRVSVQRALRDLLGAAGLSVETVADGAAATRHLHASPVDLVILDGDQPDGPASWYHGLGHAGDRPPALLMAPAEVLLSRSQALPAGMVSLPKPVRPCHLWRALDQAMGCPQDHVEAPEPRSPGRGGSRLLVVDDNLINRRAACRLLERLGATVDEAADGQTAVAMVAHTQYDLVFMDCQMPAMDGYEATARIRALKGPAARTPIVALTAYAMAGDRERCVLAGMSDYVAKPVTRAVLAEVLQRWHLLAPPAAVPEMEQPST